MNWASGRGSALRARTVLICSTFIYVLFGGGAAHGAAGTLVPNSDLFNLSWQTHIASGGTCNASAGSYIGIDEDIDAPSDDACTGGALTDDLLRWTSASGEAESRHDLSNAPADLLTLTDITVRTRAFKQGGKTVFVHVYVHRADGTQVGTPTSHNVATSWSNYSYTVSGLNLTKADTDALYVRVQASTGTSGPATSAYVSAVNIDITYSGAANQLPTAPALASPSDGLVTVDTTPTLTATFSDPDAADTGTLGFELCSVAVAAGQSCTDAGGSVLASGSSPAGVSNGTNGSWTPGTALPSGVYHWHAMATDSSGGVGPWSASWQVRVDAAPNTPSHVSPSSGTVTTDGTPTVTATFSDPDAADTGTLEFVLCSVAVTAGQDCVSAGGAVIETGTSAAGILNGADASFTPAATLGSGLYHWHVRAIDQHGIAGAWSASWELRVDQAPSTPTLVSPADTASLSDTTPTLVATFHDPDAGDGGSLEFQICSLSDCSIVNASGASATGIANGADGDWTPATSLANGTWYWRTRGVDQWGIAGAWSSARSFTVNVSLTLTVDSATADAGIVSPGVDSSSTSLITVATTNVDGYTITATDESDTIAVDCGCGGSLPDWSGTGSIPTAWDAGISGYMGVTVLDATGGRLVKWGTGVGSATDVTTNLYAGLDATTPATMHAASTATTGDTLSVQYRLNPLTTTPAGAYSGSVTYTAVANP